MSRHAIVARSSPFPPALRETRACSVRTLTSVVAGLLYAAGATSRLTRVDERWLPPTPRIVVIDAISGAEPHSGLLMAKERFDVAAAVEDMKYRRIVFLDAIDDYVIPHGKAAQAGC